jgi:hypothetical protein
MLNVEPEGDMVKHTCVTSRCKGDELSEKKGREEALIGGGKKLTDLKVEALNFVVGVDSAIEKNELGSQQIRSLCTRGSRYHVGRVCFYLLLD